MADKVVIITGASSGIGQAVARLAARKGYKLVLFARREDRLRSLESKIKDAGGETLVVVGDATKQEDLQRLVDETVGRFGRIDVLLNNAGLPLPASFSDSSPEDLKRQWDVNVTALSTLTRLALPHLRESKGTVINVGSLISRLAIPGMGNYSPTKVAVAALTNALRRELEPQGIHVCLVEPGPIATEFSERAGGQMSSADRIHVPVTEAARPIVRLFEHPRKLTVVPGWMGPVMRVVSSIGHFTSPVLDLFFSRVGGRYPLERTPKQD